VIADWERLLDVSVHPTRVEILSAMEWLAQPLSAVDLTLVLEHEEHGPGRVGYHMRKLSEDGFVELVSTRPTRGTFEHFYLLARS
jgi:DNA-binding transcriptional ArsR family regulator